MQKPLLAITMGDPAGVGPETIVGAWSDRSVHDCCRAVVVGHPEILKRAVVLLHSEAEVVEVSSPTEARPGPRTIPCLPCGPDAATLVPAATVDARAGQAAHDALVLATDLALAGRVDGITTAPLNKLALWQAGHHYAGHTDLLAELCGCGEATMMLYLPPHHTLGGRRGLGVVHVTLHTALRNIFQQLTSEKIVAAAKLADTAMRVMPGAGPAAGPLRIGVCALNPHAGEEGLFGDEELRIIAPAVQQARQAGLLIEGPLPTDTLMVQAAEGTYDAVVAMYHDQGHIALKLLGMYRAVNITLGLPIVRTSVAHGTAFDLAWQGRAESSGMVQSLRIAAHLAVRREQLVWPEDAVAS